MQFARTKFNLGPRQRGLSLVSLLVGLALSLLCLVAAMHSYRVAVLNSRSATLVARENSASAGLTLQLAKLLPQAGWGLNPGESAPGGRANIDLVLLADAELEDGRLSGTATTLSTDSAQGSALVWATAVNGSIECRSLVATAQGGLQLLGPQECTSASDATQAAWGRIVTLVPADVYPNLSLRAAMTECWPFGGRLTRTSAQVELLGTRQALPATCLPNIQP